jgi:tRNA threonylcarbamoyladenosine biosynthesis protein TsaB
MNILMIDTSGPACGVAIQKDGQIVCEMQLTSGKTHSQRVMPMADSALALCEMGVKDIDLFGAVVGPGSFTGVRIGVSTVKALAHAAGKPCIGVDALHALAANISGFDGVICPILDARAQQVYGAMFRAGDVPQRLMDDEAMKLVGFLDLVDKTGENALFLGDGVAPLRAKIEERLGSRANFVSAQHMNLRAGSACALAAKLAEADEQAVVDYVHLLPLYLRAPQAERERAAREGKQNG